MSCSCTSGSLGNPISQIPLKQGEALSTACERANVTGSIPDVISYANFTLVDGGAVAGVTSNGGIVNTASFFTARKDCYNNPNSKLASTCA